MNNQLKSLSTKLFEAEKSLMLEASTNSNSEADKVNAQKTWIDERTKIERNQANGLTTPQEKKQEA